LDPSSAADNIPGALRLTGDLDIEILSAAVTDVIGRHETLRTRYPEIDGVGFQEILGAGDVAIDLTPVDVAPADLEGEVLGIFGRPFDVSVEVPVRMRLLRTAPSEYILVVVLHHIAGDGLSLFPLTVDLMAAYTARLRGDTPQWVPLPVQYADFALWQREVLGSELDASSVISQQLAYWESVLGGVPDEVELPWDRPRPVVASYRGGRVDDVVIDAGLHAGISELARRYNATPFMVVHAALAVVLARLSGSDDVVVGTPVAGRGEAALDHLVGMFVNTLVLRTSVTGSMSFADLLREVSDSDLGAFGHSDVPFERLVEVLNPPRSQGRHP
ncbi:condensation domain-containing protein, partial [Millisia brevis]|uniref:condensation domain-containing protein n=1 Tax=Millisia brevis TaxID=264148 RepID=UPI000B2C4C71